MRRRGIGRRPSLIGTAARTAVVAGTASAVVGHSAQRAAERSDTAARADAFDASQRQAEIDAAAQQAVAAQQSDAAVAAPAAPSLVEQLQELAALKEQGILDDAEFSAAKATLLGT